MLMILCLFNCESDGDKFFEFLNSQHPNVKFTFEKQVNKQISFWMVLMLQTMLLRTTNYLILDIFQQMLNVRLIGFVNFIAKV